MEARSHSSNGSSRSIKSFFSRLSRPALSCEPQAALAVVKLRIVSFLSSWSDALDRYGVESRDDEVLALARVPYLLIVAWDFDRSDEAVVGGAISQAVQLNHWAYFGAPINSRHLRRLR